MTLTRATYACQTEETIHHVVPHLAERNLIWLGSHDNAQQRRALFHSSLTDLEWFTYGGENAHSLDGPRIILLLKEQFV